MLLGQFEKDLRFLVLFELQMKDGVPLFVLEALQRRLNRICPQPGVSNFISLPNGADPMITSGDKIERQWRFTVE